MPPDVALHIRCSGGCRGSTGSSKAASGGTQRRVPQVPTIRAHAYTFVLHAASSAPNVPTFRADAYTFVAHAGSSATNVPTFRAYAYTFALHAGSFAPNVPTFSAHAASYRTLHGTRVPELGAKNIERRLDTALVRVDFALVLRVLCPVPCEPSRRTSLRHHAADDF